jgi:hypothetical protein
MQDEEFSGDEEDEEDDEDDDEACTHSLPPRHSPLTLSPLPRPSLLSLELSTCLSLMPLSFLTCPSTLTFISAYLISFMCVVLSVSTESGLSFAASSRLYTVVKQKISHDKQKTLPTLRHTLRHTRSVRRIREHPNTCRKVGFAGGVGVAAEKGKDDRKRNQNERR